MAMRCGKSRGPKSFSQKAIETGLTPYLTSHPHAMVGRGRACACSGITPYNPEHIVWVFLHAHPQAFPSGKLRLRALVAFPKWV